MLLPPDGERCTDWDALSGQCRYRARYEYRYAEGEPWRRVCGRHLPGEPRPANFVMRKVEKRS